VVAVQNAANQQIKKSIPGAYLVDPPGRRPHAKAILAAGRRSSVPAVPFSQGPISASSSTTGMRLWIVPVNALASVTTIVHEVTSSPV